jgi:hypothetical protein
VCCRQVDFTLWSATLGQLVAQIGLQSGASGPLQHTYWLLRLALMDPTALAPPECSPGGGRPLDTWTAACGLGLGLAVVMHTGVAVLAGARRLRLPTVATGAGAAPGNAGSTGEGALGATTLSLEGVFLGKKGGG